MTKKFTVVVSRTNDECSLCNRIFEDHNEAWKYLQEAEKNSGCELEMKSMVMVHKGKDPWKPLDLNSVCNEIQETHTEAQKNAPDDEIEGDGSV